MWEQTCSVSFIAHAEQHEIESIVALLSPAEHITEFLLVEHIGIRQIREHRMHLFLRDV